MRKYTWTDLHEFEQWEGEVGDPSTCDVCGVEESKHAEVVTTEEKQ